MWRRLAQAASTACTRCTARSLLTCPCLGSLLGFGPWERGEQNSCVAWLQARGRVSSSGCALSARPGVACTGVHCQMLRSGAQSAAAADREGNLGAWPAGVNLADHQQPVKTRWRVLAVRCAAARPWGCLQALGGQAASRAHTRAKPVFRLRRPAKAGPPSRVIRESSMAHRAPALSADASRLPPAGLRGASGGCCRVQHSRCQGHARARGGCAPGHRCLCSAGPVLFPDTLL